MSKKPCCDYWKAVCYLLRNYESVKIRFCPECGEELEAMVKGEMTYPKPTPEDRAADCLRTVRYWIQKARNEQLRALCELDKEIDYLERHNVKKRK